MDRNQIIGLLIIFALIIGYGIYTQPSKEEIAKAQHKRDSISNAQKAQAQSDSIAKIAAIKSDSAKTDEIPDSLKKKDLAAIYGTFSNAVEGSKEFITIENNVIKLTLSTLGGKPYSVELKQYKTFDKKPLILFDGDSTIFGFDFFAQNRSFTSNQLYFVPTDKETKKIVIDKQQSVGLRLYSADNKYIEYQYTLHPNSYMVDFNINLKGMNDIVAQNSNYMTLNWEYYVRNQEKGKSFENDNTSLYYKFYEDEVGNLSERKEKAEENLRTRVHWIAFKQQFFSSVIIAGNYFASAYIKSERFNENKHLKLFTSQISIPFQGNDNETIPMKFYFGPNNYSSLKEFKLDLDKLVPLGWGIFGWINRFVVIWLFGILGSFISNYGIIILILTLIIKLVLMPLTYKSYLSTAKMRILKPEIDELNKKFPKEKAMEKQQAVMALYRKAGVNPLGGCLPVALQMPILIAMFRFFPASIELRQQPFLWAEDLSSYDSILDFGFNIPWYGDHISLFCLLMTISTIIYTKISQGQTPDTGTQLPGMKYMMYFFPAMMLFWFNNYASGLSYYYLVANLMSFAQMAIIKRFVDDEAIMKQLHENKKKAPTKSKFQERLEKMAKQRGYNLPKR